MKMFYFGPWETAGHHFHGEGGFLHHSAFDCCPWQPYGNPGIDCALQPGCVWDKDGHLRSTGNEIEGQALLHHKDGWTALSFWDRSVDHRGRCNSTYFAEGIFTFDEMVEMAKTRFASRWNKMNFPVRLAGSTEPMVNQ